MVLRGSTGPRAGEPRAAVSSSSIFDSCETPLASAVGDRAVCRLPSLALSGLRPLGLVRTAPRTSEARWGSIAASLLGSGSPERSIPPRGGAVGDSHARSGGEICLRATQRPTAREVPWTRRLRDERYVSASRAADPRLRPGGRGIASGISFQNLCSPPPRPSPTLTGSPAPPLAQPAASPCAPRVRPPRLPLPSRLGLPGVPP